MTTRFHQDGKILDYAPAVAVSSDDIIVTGDIIGIALADIPANEVGAIGVDGVYAVPKVAGEAWVVGNKLGYDVSALAFDLTFTAAAGDVINCGVAAKAAASADVIGYIKLTPGTGTGQ